MFLRRRRFAVGVLATVCLISLGASSAGCGNSGESSQADSASNPWTKKLWGEIKELRRQYPPGICGPTLVVNARAACEFARNAENVFYAEIGLNEGPIHPFDPSLGRDVKLTCTDDLPHKCRGANGVLVYFW